MVHLEQGLSILCRRSDVKQHPISPRDQRQRSTLNSDLIREHVIPIFSRLSILPLMFGCPPSPIQETIVSDTSFLTHLDIPSAFSTLPDARSSLVHLLGLCLRFVRSADTVRFDYITRASSLNSLVQHQSNLLSALEQWYIAFSPLIQSDSIGLTSVESSPRDPHTKRVL